MINLHKIEVENISSLLLNKYTVHDLTITCYVSSSISLACSLMGIIPAYCIQYTLDKHNFERKIVIVFLLIRFNL